MIREPDRPRPQLGRSLPATLLLVGALAATAGPPTATPSPSPPLRARLGEAVEKAQRLVEKVRGVPFPGPVASGVMPQKRLEAYLKKKIQEDLPVPFDRYAASLEALGLIEEEPALEQKVMGLYARQVAGFYDPEARKFWIVPERSREVDGEIPGLGISAASLTEDALLTHELTHALQDRRLGLDRLMKSVKDSSDGSLALEAFLEGEATVVMTEAILTKLPPEARSVLSPEALSKTMASVASGEQEIEGAEDVPEYFVKELLFPYVAGTAWIEKLRSKGGWSAVDAAYSHLPRTTADILHPNGSPARRETLTASEEPSARDLPPGTRPLYRDTLGEWTLRTLLQIGGADEPESTAADWQDDRILFFEEKSGRGPVGFVWRVRCATPAGATRLAAALGDIYTEDEDESPLARVTADGPLVEVVRGLEKGESAALGSHGPWSSFRAAGRTTKSWIASNVPCAKTGATTEPVRWKATARTAVIATRPT